MAATLRDFSMTGGSLRLAVMSKVILLSSLIAMIALPVRAAKEKNPRVGLKKALLYMVAFNACYLLALRFIVRI
jgi:hypothetical protein